MEYIEPDGSDEDHNDSMRIHLQLQVTVTHLRPMDCY